MVDGLDWHFCQWKMCPNIALVNERLCVDHMERIAKISERNRKRAATPQQIRVLVYTITFMRDHGYPPTVREITAGLHISSTSVTQYHLDRLAVLGHIERDPNVSRGIRILEGANVRSTDQVLPTAGR